MRPALLSRRGSISSAKVPFSSALVVDSPIAPSRLNYTIPGGATSVATFAQLQTALDGSTPIDIRITGNIVSTTTWLNAWAGHRVWCDEGVVLNCGIDYRTSSGGEWHGGTFNVSNMAYAASPYSAAPEYAVFCNWGGSGDVNMSITDVTIDGNGVCHFGIYLINPGGLTLRRAIVRNTTYNGIHLTDNSLDYTSVKAMNVVSDLEISAIYIRDDVLNGGSYHEGRGSGDGWIEAGLWVGNHVLNGVTRLKISDCGWMGIWTGAGLRNTVFSHFVIDDIHGVSSSVNGAYAVGTPVYWERITRDCEFHTFRINNGAGVISWTGFNGEWDLGISGTAAAQGLNVHHGHIVSEQWGIYVDQGSRDCVFHDIKFVGQSEVCIGYNNTINLVPANFYGNDYSGRDAGCVRSAAAHYSGTTFTETSNPVNDVTLEY